MQDVFPGAIEMANFFMDDTQLKQGRLFYG
jgi:hypothetical protein